MTLSTDSAVNSKPIWSTHLNAVRGLASVFVVLEHLRLLFFVKFPMAEHKTVLLKMMYLMSSMGHNAVVIFFVLSGFFIASSIFRLVDRGMWSWTLYAVHRLSRLYIVLVPALILGAIVDVAGLHFFGNSDVYLGKGALATMIKAPISQSVDLDTWAGNLLFLQGILVATYGSNKPLWSLSYEFWYYVLFPISLGVLSSNTKVAVRCLYVALAVVIWFFVGHAIQEYFVIWLLGAGVALLKRSGRRWRPGYVVNSMLGILLFVALTLVRSGKFSDSFAQPLSVGLLLSLLVYIAVSADPDNGHRRGRVYAMYSKLSEFLSKQSYTLYLVHAPLIVFISAFTFPHGHLWQPNTLHLLYGTFLLLLVMMYANLMWRLAESNTDRVRIWMEHQLGLVPSAVMQSAGDVTQAK